MNQTGNLLSGKGGQFELACLFWSTICNIWGSLVKVGHGLNLKILLRNLSKSKHAQNHYFLINLHPHPNSPPFTYT